jgi:hypothetical protein
VSHHMDSPLARSDTRLDLTDNFAFRGETGTVLIMNVNTSLSGERRVPGFHPEARYEFKIHFDGLLYEDLTYRFEFGERDRDGRQSVEVHRLVNEDARDETAIGVRIAEGETGTAIPSRADDGIWIWAGDVHDPFYLDATLLDVVRKAVDRGSRFDLGEWQPSTATNSFGPSEVCSIVLEMPESSYLFADRNMATWSVTKLPTDDNGWRQINRVGLPMMWSMFRPDNTDYASEANIGIPADDWTKDSAHISKLVAGIAGAYGAANPQAYGDMLADRLLPDILPYQVGAAGGLTFAGFNGRMLADNAPEVMYSLLANSAIDVGLTPDVAAATRSDQFPYVIPL